MQPIPLELLAPAQGPEQLAMALHFGADAVYLAAPRWGMRAGARNFSEQELAAAVGSAHEAGAAVHLTLNTVMRDEDVDALPPFLARIDEMGVDAAIVADLGAMDLLRRHAPHVALHVSTQASVMSAAAAEAYARLGARRIVLAREMGLGQVTELRRRIGDEVELEVFAHGSLCMAYSGRCLVSADLMGAERSPSRGACAQPCRWAWQLAEAGDPGATLPACADDAGTYLLSSDDLCLIGHLGELAEAGVTSIKLEGRAKGSYYTACVTNAYRQVLDGADPAYWRAELDLVSHRPYSTGFLFGAPRRTRGHAGYDRARTMVAVADGCAPAADGWLAEVRCRNRAAAGVELEVLSPGNPVRSFVLRDPERLDADGSWCREDGLSRNGATYRLPVPWPLAPWDVLCVRSPSAGAPRVG